jgi:hypothetical protein
LLPVTGTRGSYQPSWLDRVLAHPFGSVGYAKEQLRAEIASLPVAARLDIANDPGQHATYVKSWIQVIEKDPNEILRASRDADKICSHLLGLEKGWMPSSIDKLPGVSRTQPQPAPAHRAPRAVDAGRNPRATPPPARLRRKPLRSFPK